MPRRPSLADFAIAACLLAVAGCTSSHKQESAANKGSIEPAKSSVSLTNELKQSSRRAVRDGAVRLASGETPIETSARDDAPPNPLRDPSNAGNAGTPAPAAPGDPGFTPGAPAVPHPVADGANPAPPMAMPAAGGAKPNPPSTVPAPQKTASNETPPLKVLEEPGAANEAHVGKLHSRPLTAKNSGIPFDPEKENGKYFVDWPKPLLTLVFTGRQDGYMEPCGCAGLERMKGGMSRRDTMIKSLRAKDWNVIAMDVGGIAKGFGKQAELKFQFMLDGMRTMDYKSIGLGLADFQLPPEEVLALIAPISKAQKGPYVSGNVGLFQFDEDILPRTQTITDAKSNKRIGVTAIVGESFQRLLASNPALKTIKPVSLLDAALPKLKSEQRPDYLVVLAYADLPETIALAKRYPDVDVFVTMGGGDVPPAQPMVMGNTKIVEVGEKGMYASVLGIYDKPQPMRYQRVALDSRYKSSKAMTDLMGAYQFELKTMGLSGLGIHALPNPLEKPNGDYVGSDACQDCHTKSYNIWKQSGHAMAFKTLQEAKPPREFDPECISCHTVGWLPTKFIPYKSGYMSQKETPKLINVGCEDCHGPGQMHIAAENGADAKLRKASEEWMRLTLDEAKDPNSKKQNCRSCHDQDNSPEFKFELYWPLIAHHERD
jgi:hypothetical protein